MKMKKLTALVLAGVLCMGMSTVALAAPSVGPADAYSAIGKDGKKVNLKVDDVEEWYEHDWQGNRIGRKDSLRFTEDYDGWDSADSNDVSKAVKQTLISSSKQYDVEIDNLRKLEDPELAGKIAELEKQKAAVDELANSNVLIEIADLVELDIADHADPAYPVTTKTPLKVRFVLNKRLEDLEVGQQIRIMHKVDGLWQVYEGEVQWDAATSEFYVEHLFTELSPVAILRINSDGSAQITPPANDPTNGSTNGSIDEQPTVTPDANGNITADQLAELLAKKLQANGAVATVNRTAVSSKASPKTGE